MLRFETLWNNHPFPNFPCNVAVHRNQCAIRMGIALQKSGVNLSSFNGAFCWENGHNPKHILRAQELADWMAEKFMSFGPVIKMKRKEHPDLNAKFFIFKKCIIFIKDGWGSTDHIDLWDRHQLKGAPESDYLSKGTEIWFWPMF